MYTKKILLLLLCCLISLTCEDGSKKESDIPKEEYVWQPHPSFFRLDKILLNSHVNNDSLYVVGVNRVSIFDTTSDNPVINGSLFRDPDITQRPAMGGRFIAFPNKDKYQSVVYSPVFLSCSGNSGLYPFGEWLRLGSLSESYFDGARVIDGYYSQPFGAINSYNQLVMMINDSTNCYNCYTSFALVNLNPESYNMYSTPCLNIEPTVRRIPYMSGMSLHLNDIIAYKDKFLFSAPRDQYEIGIIDTSGNLFTSTDIQGLVHSFFTNQDTVFAFTAYTGDLYRSGDGFQWSPWLGGFPQYDLRFFVINNKICFFIYSQLFWLDYEHELLVELDNTGLEGFEINSVKLFHNKIWITTLSGLFTKPIDRFFDEKEESLSKPGYRHITISNNKLKKY